MYRVAELEVAPPSSPYQQRTGVVRRARLVRELLLDPVLPPVSTILTRDERLRVDAAGQGLYCATHRDTIDDVVRDVRERRAAAVLVSVSRCGEHEAARVAAMVREFPRVPAVALLTHVETTTPQTVLALGRGGVRTLVDVRMAAGWRALRAALTPDRAADLEREAVAQLRQDLAGVPADCWRFFETLFTTAPRTATIRQLSRELGVVPATLNSRFFRAELPTPKQYLATARLTRAARLFESPGLSVSTVANHLDYSSPQSFGRHVRTILGLTARELRDRYDGEGMLRRFREELVLPHLPVLRAFTPLTPPTGWRKRK